jgi:hypothetical protein
VDAIIEKTYQRAAHIEQVILPYAHQCLLALSVSITCFA